MNANVNIWAVLVAALATFLLGGFWYSPALFGKLWAREAGVDPAAVEKKAEKKGQKHPAMVFFLAYVFSVIAAYALAVLLGPNPETVPAVKLGLMVGACFVATSFGINYQFAGKSFLLLLIDGGYHIVQFVLFGLILGVWP